MKIISFQVREVILKLSKPSLFSNMELGWEVRRLDAERRYCTWFESSARFREPQNVNTIVNLLQA